MRACVLLPITLSPCRHEVFCKALYDMLTWPNGHAYLHASQINQPNWLQHPASLTRVTIRRAPQNSCLTYMVAGTCALWSASPCMLSQEYLSTPHWRRRRFILSRGR